METTIQLAELTSEAVGCIGGLTVLQSMVFSFAINSSIRLATTIVYVLIIALVAVTGSVQYSVFYLMFVCFVGLLDSVFSIFYERG